MATCAPHFVTRQDYARHGATAAHRRASALGARALAEQEAAAAAEAAAEAAALEAARVATREDVREACEGARAFWVSRRASNLPRPSIEARC